MCKIGDFPLQPKLDEKVNYYYYNNGKALNPYDYTAPVGGNGRHSGLIMGTGAQIQFSRSKTPHQHQRTSLEGMKRSSVWRCTVAFLECHMP